jgi:hypothetical protein
VQPGQGIVIEDETGQAQYGIIPYVETSPEERAAASKRIKRLQQMTRKAMKEQGVTEADVERLLLESD